MKLNLTKVYTVQDKPYGPGIVEVEDVGLARLIARVALTEQTESTVVKEVAESVAEIAEVAGVAVEAETPVKSGKSEKPGK